MQEAEISKEELDNQLELEYERAKFKATAVIDAMSKKDLKRMLMVFVGVYGNKVKLSSNEENNLEHLKLAMENFMSVMQAKDEL